MRSSLQGIETNVPFASPSLLCGSHPPCSFVCFSGKTVCCPPKIVIVPRGKAPAVFHTWDEPPHRNPLTKGFRTIRRSW